MAMMDSSGWSGQDHQMQNGPEDDFQQFLDMGSLPNISDGLNFEYHDFQSGNGAHLLQAPPREQMDTPMDGTEASVMARADPALQHQMPAMTTAASYQTIPTTIMPPPTPSEAIVDSIDAQIQFLQQQKMQHQQRQLEEQHAVFFVNQQRQMVPLTPQSMELRPSNTRFYGQPDPAEQQAMPQQQQSTPQAQPQQQQQQVIDCRYQRLKEQQEMSFTPLVSPAVTPLESHFPVDAPFAVPAAYFSPLTSPALHPQNDPLAVFDHRLGPVNRSSPDAMDLETSSGLPLTLPTAATDGAKKLRKSASKVKSKVSVGKSPITKSQRRKTATTPNLNAQVLSELVETAEQRRDSQVQLPPPEAPPSTSSATGATDSENGSVSPQALTDTAPIEMPPPPIPKQPRSARPSPYIAPQTSATPHAHPVRPGMSSPATPASLMMLSSPGTCSVGAGTSAHDGVATEHIEKFELPEPVNNSRPSLTPIITQPVARSPADMNEPGSAKTAAFQPLPSPAFAKPMSAASATASPQIAPGSAVSNPRRTPQLLPRGSSKKRASISSSPALRPKISPNIKPLLPGGATAEESASHLLATKSNYQRILEGNQVPGISYPRELSTNLTSKRTSHKIAEQGRRNRINSALQEIATLLPRPPPKEKEDEGENSDKKDKSGQLPSSKASTVELAIEYIKQLKQDLENANKRAEEAEKKLKGPSMAENMAEE